ncbi:ABC transporter permease [Marinicrinis sediminis]|uniref:ABC transporter permease n=1 Tax=Marinicrinis sediminis TaxID=1652465 RepID=A0ABW5RF90_9BACL
MSMWRSHKPLWMTLPALIVIVVLFFGGITEGLIQSLGYFPVAGQSAFSFSAYSHILSAADFWLSFWLSLRVSLLATLFAALLGLMMSICLFLLSKSKQMKWVPFWRRWFQLPFVVPHLAGAYLIVLLCSQSGWIARLAYHFGWIDQMTEFPILVNDPFGIGVVLTYTWKEAPFISLVLYPVLLRIHDAWHEAARVFGASSFQFVKEIVLPLLLPAWFAASFIVFAFTFSAFEVPYLLGVTYPKQLPVLAYEWYAGDLSQRPEAMAVGILLVVITAMMGLLAYRLGRRWLTAGGRGWS